MNQINIKPELIIGHRFQKTIKEAAAFSGIGLHTGSQVFMRFLPAEENTGIVFKRIDLPEQTLIPATLDYVCDTSRNNTTIGHGNVRVHTVEHVLAAIRAYSIDNLMIEISSIEPPVGNGSSDIFVDMIDHAGVVDQRDVKPIVTLKEPVYHSEENISVVALPSNEYRISYVLDYPQPKVLRSQFHSIVVNTDNFNQEISQCRTFSRMEDVMFMMDKGLIKGGSLDNAVLIKGEVVLSKGGLFFPDEMSRHKILDMIGDLSLTGIDFVAHLIAIRAGHNANYHFAKKIHNYMTKQPVANLTSDELLNAAKAKTEKS